MIDLALVLRGRQVGHEGREGAPEVRVPHQLEVRLHRLGGQRVAAECQTLVVCETEMAQV